MPRQGGQGKGKPKLSERGLGVALIRNRLIRLKKIFMFNLKIIYE